MPLSKKAHLSLSKIRIHFYLFFTFHIDRHRLEKNNKSLKFFYLLKDDIFISKERTKFFDFIIPVIPVIDSSNSYDEFLKIFENEKINKIFLE